MLYVSTTIKPTVVIEVSSPDEALTEKFYGELFSLLNPEELDSRVSGIPIDKPITWSGYIGQIDSLFNRVGSRGGSYISPGFITAPALERHNVLADQDLGDKDFWEDFSGYLFCLNRWKALGVRVVHVHIRSVKKEEFQLRRMAYSLIYSWQVHNPTNPDERKSAASDWIVCDSVTDPKLVRERLRDVIEPR